MKKFIILLLAALLIAGVFVSCKEDPKPEPDAFKGTWKGKDSDDCEYTIVCDGFGKVTYTLKDGDDTQTVEGTYEASGNYVTLKLKQEIEPSSNYIYLHLVTAQDVTDYGLPADFEGKYIIHDDAASSAWVFPDDYEPTEDYPFTKDGDNYAFNSASFGPSKFVLDISIKMASSSATVSETESVYKDPYDPEAANELLCSEATIGDFTCNEVSADPLEYRLDSTTELSAVMKTQYKLTSTTLTIKVYANGDVEDLILEKE